MQTTGEILHILFVLGLPTLALVVIGVWALKREARGSARAVGYLLIAAGVILAVYTVATLVNGPLSFIVSESLPR